MVFIDKIHVATIPDLKKRCNKLIRIKWIKREPRSIINTECSNSHWKTLWSALKGDWMILKQNKLSEMINVRTIRWSWHIMLTHLSHHFPGFQSILLFPLVPSACKITTIIMIQTPGSYKNEFCIIDFVSPLSYHRKHT